jgi:predicted RNA-binding protein
LSAQKLSVLMDEAANKRMGDKFKDVLQADSNLKLRSSRSFQQTEVMEQPHTDEKTNDHTEGHS